MRTGFAGLQQTKRNLGERSDQLGIHRPRNPPVLPDADVGRRNVKLGGNLSGANARDDVGMAHGLRVTTGYASPARPKLREVTGKRVTFRHMENDWQTLTEPHERVRWARMRWQESKGIKADAGAAAESLGIQPHTYRAYERAPGSSKHTELTHQRAIQFARKYGVSWEWLMTGGGSPHASGLSELTPTERRVIDALREAPEARQTVVADAIEQLLKSA